jgi:hypothetical protein
MSVASNLDSSKGAGPRGTPCPRCAKPLTDAAGLGWCPACGYCRSLEESQVSVPETMHQAPEQKTSMGGLVELGQAVGGLPRWVWIMLLGVVGFAAISMLPARQLAPNSFERALWSVCQIGIGVSMILVAQFVAVIRLAPDDAKLSFKDVILPFRLWSLVAKRLPQTCVCAWLGAWGLTLVVSAVIFIGGLPYWMNYLPGNNKKGGKATPSSLNAR